MSANCKACAILSLTLFNPSIIWLLPQHLEYVGSFELHTDLNPLSPFLATISVALPFVKYFSEGAPNVVAEKCYAVRFIIPLPTLFGILLHNKILSSNQHVHTVNMDFDHIITKKGARVHLSNRKVPRHGTFGWICLGSSYLLTHCCVCQ